MDKRPTLIVITGPTAVGKTSISIQLAKYFKSEIISADSRQFYKGISIGTAKPSVKELSEAPHHFIDQLDLQAEYNVGDYEKDAVLLINQLFEKYPVLFLVGGSGLYVDVVCHGMDTLPDVSEEVKKNVRDNYLLHGIDYLRSELLRLDPDYFIKVDKDNPQRMCRAIEVSLSSGKPFSSFRTGEKVKRPWNIVKMGLNLEREKLYNNINTRVEEMMQMGLLQEAMKVFPQRDINALQTVGYTELFEYLENKITLERAIELIKQHTRNYAKRQLTWFRKNKDITWFAPTQFNEMVSFIRAKLELA